MRQNRHTGPVNFSCRIAWHHRVPAVIWDVRDDPAAWDDCFESVSGRPPSKGLASSGGHHGNAWMLDLQHRSPSGGTSVAIPTSVRLILVWTSDVQHRFAPRGTVVAFPTTAPPPQPPCRPHRGPPSPPPGPSGTRPSAGIRDVHRPTSTVHRRHRLLVCTHPSRKCRVSGPFPPFPKEQALHLTRL